MQCMLYIRVIYAIYAVFSHQVLAAMSLCIFAKFLRSVVLATYEFFKKTDVLFVIMNARKLFAGKPSRCALTKGKTMKNLEEIINWISILHFKKVRSQTGISSHWGLIPTINNISLSRGLLAEGFCFVCTPLFNQDCIKKRFGFKNLFLLNMFCVILLVG